MRAQTTLDFAIGITVFLAVVLFVFTFVPGILEPFDATNEEDPPFSNRVANSLSQGMLGTPDEPHILDRYCTVEFFKSSPSAGPCNYEDEPLDERLNLPSTRRLNITLTGNLSDGGDISERLCWDSGGRTLVEASNSACDSGDTELATGDNRPVNSQSTITARRVVSLHEESVTMEVVVW